MISEQEARSAAEVIRSATDHEETEWRDHNWSILAQYTIQELARRDAERKERALPIDAEWLKSIGFQHNGAYFNMKYDGGKVFVSSDKKYVYVNASPIYAIKTRSQLLDLLAALKGGES